MLRLPFGHRCFQVPAQITVSAGSLIVWWKQCIGLYNNFGVESTHSRFISIVIRWRLSKQLCPSLDVAQMQYRLRPVPSFGGRPVIQCSVPIVSRSTCDVSSLSVVLSSVNQKRYKCLTRNDYYIIVNNCFSYIVCCDVLLWCLLCNIVVVAAMISTLGIDHFE